MSRLLCVLLTLSLSACDPPRRGVRVTIRAAQDDTCRPERVLRVDFLPLADTPIAERPAQALDPESATDIQTLEPFAPETEAVRISARGSMGWEGGAIALVAGREILAVPILPLERSCELLDMNLALFEGAAVAALPDGRLAIVGGLRVPQDRPVAVREVLVVTPGEPLAQLAATQLRRERTRASATWLSDARLIVAGGTVEGAGVRDDFVILDLDADSLQDAPMMTPRYAHAAARLADGSVLIVGGRDAAGALATSAERLLLDEDGPRASAAGSSVPREDPRALRMDDGAIVVAGGLDEDGAPVRAIERWDGTSLRSVGAWDALPSAAFAALAGGRAAMVGGQITDADWSGRVVLLLPDDSQLVIEDALPALTRPSAVGLPDGRLLVTGGDDNGVRVTLVVDPGATRPTVSIPATRAAVLPQRMVRLGDGAIAQLDATGLDLLRVDLATEYDDLPAIDPGQIPQQRLLSLDGPGRWSIDPPAGAAPGPLFALADGARFDLPTVRYGALRLAVEVVGPAEVLLTPDGAPPISVEIEVDRVALGDCALEGAGQGRVEIQRGEATLALRAGGREVVCPFEETGRVGVALRLPVGSGAQRLSASRAR